MQVRINSRLVIIYIAQDHIRMYQNIENVQPPSPTKCAKVIKIINLSTGYLYAEIGH